MADMILEENNPEVAVKHSANALATHAAMLLRAALVAGGPELVAQVESALRHGGQPAVRIVLRGAGNAEVRLTIDDANLYGDPALIEVFRASGGVEQTTQ